MCVLIQQHWSPYFFFGRVSPMRTFVLKSILLSNDLFYIIFVNKVFIAISILVASLAEV